MGLIVQDRLTLNGTDWSNLYHLDYSGGCGGEYLTELIADKAGAPFEKPTLTNYEIKDSIGSQYATPHIYDYSEPFLLKGHYDTDLHSISTWGMNIKLWDYFRFDIKRHLDHLNGDATRVLHFPKHVDKIKIAREHRCTASLIVRTHYAKRDYEQFEGMKSLWMYPATQSGIVSVRMFLRRHLKAMDNFEQDRVKNRLGDKMFEWFKKRYDSGTGIYYHWQLEQALRNKNKFYNNEDIDGSFEDIVDTFMGTHSDIKVSEFRIHKRTDKDFGDVFEWKLNRLQNFINATEWLFGFSEDPFNIVEKVTGFNIKSDLVHSWQQDNIRVIQNAGMKFDSTQEECKDFILNYYKNNNIKVKVE